MLRRRGRAPLALLTALAWLVVAMTGCGPSQTFQLVDMQRSGNVDQSQSFTVSGPWTLRYSYDCTGEGSTSGLVITVVNQSDDTLIAENPDVIDTHAHAGKRTSTDTVVSYHATTGTLYLQVQSGCGWRIQIREQQ